MIRLDLKAEIETLGTTYRRLRKPEQIEVDALYRKILFITFVVGLVGVFVVLLSIIFDMSIRMVSR